jgi:Holliday junction resolvase
MVAGSKYDLSGKGEGTNRSEVELPNRNYNRGYHHENKIVNQLRAIGFFSFRVAGSHTAVDVWGALNHGNGNRTILAIQCKRGKSPFTGKDGVELCQYAQAFNARPILIRDKTWYLLEDGKFISIIIEDLLISEEFNHN